MPKGISINIGLNSVNPAAYGGWDGQLSGCINDARDMSRIATGLGYTTTTLFDSQATAAEVCRAIGQAARELDSGDICLVSYSGHGGQINDVTGDEPDGKDETWVLWDRQLLDDELNGLWSSFKAGVRIFVVSDSCHSGTVTRMAEFGQKFRSADFAAQYHRHAGDAPKVRMGDPVALRRNYEEHRAEYEISQWSHRAALQASVLLISGCQDNQLSSDGDRNGLFTQRLLEVWNDGAFSGNYTAFHQAIVARMPSDQTPNLFRTGVSNATFDAQKPFAIGGGGASTGSSSFSISAPGSFANGATPLTFSVSIPNGKFYAVEVATDADLFNNAVNGSRRTTSNFYASWQVVPFSSSSSFSMPADAWNRLRQGSSRLYYRVWRSDSSNAWVNASPSVSDSNAGSAPSVALTAPAQTGPGSTPSITIASSIPANGPAPRFQVNPGSNRYYAVEVATNPWYFVSSQYGNLRIDSNFYAAWKAVPFGSSALYPASFELPADAWIRLKAGSANGRLYYRMWWSDSPNSWVNQGCTTLDSNGQNAPSFALAREGDLDS